MSKYRRGFRDSMVASIALDTGMPRRKVRMVADGLLYELTGAMVRGERAIIENFGTFKVLSTPLKRGRNFKTGSAIIIPQRWWVKFSPSKILLKNINKCME